MRAGIFVAFEGGEGGGKSTQARALAEALEASGHSVVLTREPGGTDVGRAIRSVLLDTTHAGMADRAEALLYAADRADHVERVIRPALALGKIVICDRYVDSSRSYQGFGRRLDLREITELSSWATGGLVPHLTVILDIDPAVGLGRTGGFPDRMDSESIAFHTRVRQGFLDLAAEDLGRYLILDATADQSVVAAKVLDRVQHVLNATADSD
jgi:dTMP kinase